MAPRLRLATFGKFIFGLMAGFLLVWHSLAARQSLTFAQDKPPGVARTAQSIIRVLIPFYNYPAWYDAPTYLWDDLAASNSNVAITAIINPNNGPDGGPPNADYVVGLNTLRNAGITLVGYVMTNYGARPLAQVKADIDLYNAHYNINGIFLDQASSQSSNLAYYRELYTYIKNLPNLDLVIINPGTSLAEGYLSQPAADIVMIVDDTAAAWSAFTPEPYSATYPAERFAVAVYQVADAAALHTAIDLARARNVGYVYFTDDIDPNPWDRLPTFWQTELNYIATVNSTLTRTPTAIQTPTPTTTTTPDATTLSRPDLIVTALQIELETGGSCSYSSTQLGVRVTVNNIGNAAAGPFVVAVNTLQKSVSEGLAVGAGTTVWLPGAVAGETTATVDATGVIEESNENNNSLTQFLPIPTLPPTCTPTTPPTPPTPVATTPKPTGASQLYLPAIARALSMPTPTFTPIVTRTWQQIAGDNDLTVAKVAVQGETLIVGARGDNNEPTRGLYSGSLTSCRAGVALGRVRAIPVGSVFDIIFSGVNGVTTSYDHGIFYTNDGGGIWQAGTPAVSQPRTVAVVTDLFFVGTEASGVYLSTNGGRTWTQRRNEPAQINVVKLDVKAPDLLWIGAHEKGVYSLRIGNTDTFVQNSAGLNGTALNVWDFAFATTQIYLATENGVFVGDGIGPWRSFDPSPPGVAFYSLELVGNTLYAGARDNGVWRKALTGGAWERLSAPGWNENHTVRDLLYENTYCQGLLAATEDGVWLYR